MKKFSCLTILLLGLLVGIAHAQIKPILVCSDTTAGYLWGSPVISGNTLYGASGGGGANLRGCIFCLNKDGSGYKDLFDFNGTNGSKCYATLVMAGGKFYGQPLRAELVVLVVYFPSILPVKITRNCTISIFPMGMVPVPE